MRNYYDLLSEEQKKAKQTAAAYEAERRAHAQQLAAQADASYGAQREAYRRQAQTTLRDTEAAYAQAFDAHAVDELVARRRASEAIANSNLGNSGLNNTQQTAISLRRMKADADTAASRQAAVERVMQALDEREALLSRQAAAERDSIVREAEKDIDAYREKMERLSWDRTDERYKAEGTKTVVYAGGGTRNADMTYTPSYVTVSTNAKMRQRRIGDDSASDYLHNMFGIGHISFEQWKTLHETLRIVPCEGYSYGSIRAILRLAAQKRGEREARLFLEYLHENNIVSTEDMETLRNDLYTKFG